jgi:hypothetical protein
MTLLIAAGNRRAEGSTIGIKLASLHGNNRKANKQTR